MAENDEGSLPKTSWFLCMSDEVGTLTLQDGKAVRFIDSEGGERVCSGDVSPSGHVTVEIAGKPPQGEEGTEETCKRLYNHLNALGAGFTNLEISNEKHIDAKAFTLDGGRVNIQVIRALSRKAFWKELGESKYHRITKDCWIESTLTSAEAVETLRQAIEDKHKPELDGFILALDATDVPGLSLDAVREAFNAQYGGWVVSLGFYQVWVVGPWPEMIHQLGLSSPE